MSEKKIVAEAIHQAAEDSEAKPYILINCAHTPSNILDNELFGSEKAGDEHSKQIGKFELAHNGTIVLDEVTELSPAIQAKLLKVLQDKEIERTGSKIKIPIRTRVIATTNKNIVDCVNKGKFRQDLYYRLYILQIAE